MRPAAFAFVLVVLMLSLAAAARGDGAWKSLGTKDGVVYEQREIAGSKYYEHRATFTVPIAAEQVLPAVWEQALVPGANAQLKREFLRKSDDEFLAHDEVTHPIVTDREVTLLVEKTRAPLGLRFASRNDLGPPPNPRRIQLPRVYGSWTIEPLGPRESRLTYVCYSEPGGSIAAFLVRGAQAKQIVRDVQRVKAKLGL